MSEYPTQEQDSRIRIRWTTSEASRPGWLKDVGMGRKPELTVDPKKARVWHFFQREEVDKLVAELGAGYEAVETDIGTP